MSARRTSRRISLLTLILFGSLALFGADVWLLFGPLLGCWFLAAVGHGCLVSTGPTAGRRGSVGAVVAVREALYVLTTLAELEFLLVGDRPRQGPGTGITCHVLGAGAREVRGDFEIAAFASRVGRTRATCMPHARSTAGSCSRPVCGVAALVLWPVCSRRPGSSWPSPSATAPPRYAILARVQQVSKIETKHTMLFLLGDLLPSTLMAKCNTINLT